MKKTQDVLKFVLSEITPSNETMKYLREETELFINHIQKRINKFKIDVEPFVGGSFAKNTIIKKGSYDVDLFLRFDKKYTEGEIKKLTKKILKKSKGLSIVHGSRDYYKVKINPWFAIEVVPVSKISTPKDAKNITDLSYSHVKYIKKRVKSKEVENSIKLAKAFCHGIGVYGAESYISGFSGYAIELLAYHYKTFEKMLKELSKNKGEKIIIDIEKLYKNKSEILIEMNGSKLISPIILIDPTFKERNALAALSDEKFEIFKKKAKEFLKNPSIEIFFPRKINLDDLKKESKEKGYEFVLIKTKTKKQKGDIAGTKLLKFNKQIKVELDKCFEIKDFGFKYDGEKEGRGYFVLKKRDHILFNGPTKDDLKNKEKFEKEHKDVYIEKGRLYAKEKINVTSKEFLKNWAKKNKRKIKEMYISNIKII